MKGVVFTEFVEMVEQQFSLEVADDMIEKSHLPSGGAYTSAGTYEHKELVDMVVNLSDIVEIPVPDLIRSFGTHMFGRFSQGFPGFFAGVTGSFEFLGTIENYIHVEVRKLYPDAELPTFECSVLNDNEMKMIYKSSRHFSDLAEGLMIGCFKHFNENISIQKIDNSAEDKAEVTFMLSKEG